MENLKTASEISKIEEIRKEKKARMKFEKEFKVEFLTFIILFAVVIISHFFISTNSLISLFLILSLVICFAFHKIITSFIIKHFNLIKPISEEDLKEEIKNRIEKAEKNKEWYEKIIVENNKEILKIDKDLEELESLLK